MLAIRYATCYIDFDSRAYRSKLGLSQMCSVDLSKCYNRDLTVIHFTVERQTARVLWVTGEVRAWRDEWWWNTALSIWDNPIVREGVEDREREFHRGSEKKRRITRGLGKLSDERKVSHGLTEQLLNIDRDSKESNVWLSVKQVKQCKSTYELYGPLLHSCGPHLHPQY